MGSSHETSNTFHDHENLITKAGMVTHTFNPSIKGMIKGRWWVWSQPTLHSETLSLKKRKGELTHKLYLSLFRLHHLFVFRPVASLT